MSEAVQSKRSADQLALSVLNDGACENPGTSSLTVNSSDARLVHELYQERELLALQLASYLGRWAELA